MFSYLQLLTELYVEMRDEIFHFEIFKTFRENMEIIQDPFLKDFTKII